MFPAANKKRKTDEIHKSALTRFDYVNSINFGVTTLFFLLVPHASTTDRRKA